jgi:DNA-binding NtrC family response regulator
MESNIEISALRILLVDDDEPLRRLLHEYLRGKGMIVHASKDAEEALETLQREKEAFDVVLTDLVLPGKGGLEILRSTKELNRDTQVVIMTGYASLESAIDSMRCGAFDYITKPFKLVEIEIVLSKISERKRLIDENQKLAERVQSLYSRLDLLKDNRSKLDRFIAETADKLEDHSKKIDDCLEMLKRFSAIMERPNSVLPSVPRNSVIT